MIPLWCLRETMARRKFTDDLDDEEGDGEGPEGEEDEERVQFTQRMPSGLEERVQEYCEEYGGMARNTAVNVLVKRALENEGF